MMLICYTRKSMTALKTKIHPNTLIYGSTSKWPKEVIGYTDGASRGNPGVASLGLSVEDFSGNKVFEMGERIGIATNNVAEYKGIEKLLELAVKNKVNKLYLKTDSQLITRQLEGVYKIKSPNLKKIHQRCVKWIEQIPNFSITHIFREQNQRADELANLILDQTNEVNGVR